MNYRTRSVQTSGMWAQLQCIVTEDDISVDILWIKFDETHSALSGMAIQSPALCIKSIPSTFLIREIILCTARSSAGQASYSQFTVVGTICDSTNPLIFFPLFPHRVPKIFSFLLVPKTFRTGIRNNYRIVFNRISHSTYRSVRSERRGHHIRTASDHPL